MACHRSSRCFFSLPSFPLSPSGSMPFTSCSRDGGLSISDADPLIGVHADHWLVCIEWYEQSRRFRVGRWQLLYQDIESCVYGDGVGCSAIVCFRGTSDAKDLYDDREISLGRTFPRAVEAMRFVGEFVKLNPSVRVELTGHSLGGAVAREVGKTLNLRVVTFNAAAPPSAPVISGASEVDYHIVFDIISAWQSPNTVRIDKGFRPLSSVAVGIVMPSMWVWHLFSGLLPSHSLINFSNQLPGTTVTVVVDDGYLQRWFFQLPLGMQTAVLGFLLGASGRFAGKLPSMK